jgi:acyl carrier protein
MDNSAARLAHCFRAVFPELSQGDVGAASTESVSRWDSLASATLMALIEEEFGIALSPEALDDFTSFERILAHVERDSLSRESA